MKWPPQIYVFLMLIIEILSIYATMKDCNPSANAFKTQEGLVDVQDANLLIQINASILYDDQRQVIKSNGKEILNKFSEQRAIRATKLRFENDAWTLVKTDTFNNYPHGGAIAVDEAERLNAFLKSFVDEEILVLSTSKEPIYLG